MVLVMICGRWVGSCFSLANIIYLGLYCTVFNDDDDDDDDDDEYFGK